MARLCFEFDPRKAASNLKKHDVSFAEAITVVDDPFAQTFPDELHSDDEDRFIPLVYHHNNNCCSSRTWRPTIASALLVPATPNPLSDTPMKNSKAVIEADPLPSRPLDLSKGGSGKYFQRMREGTNVVLIAPDLIDTFPDSDSVNEAHRSLKKIAVRTAKSA